MPRRKAQAQKDSRLPRDTEGCQAKTLRDHGVLRIILPASLPGMQVWHLLRPEIAAAIATGLCGRKGEGRQKGKIPPILPALLLDETRCSWTLMSESGSKVQGLDCFISPGLNFGWI